MTDESGDEKNGTRPLFSAVNDHILLPVLQGATIRRDDATGAVIVARIMRGGAADRSGKLCFFSFCHSGLSVPVVPNRRAAKDNNSEIILKGCLMVIRVGKNKHKIC